MSNEPRTTMLRKSTDLDSSSLKLPFVFIQAQFGYSVESILRPIHGSSRMNLGTYPDTFPNTIEEFYWIHPGNPGKTPWIVLGKLQNDLYFFYMAECIDTQKTFLDWGQMNLWVSHSYSELVQYAMDVNTYKKYINDTMAITE